MRGYVEQGPEVQATYSLQRAARLLAAAELSCDYAAIDAAKAVLNDAACAYYKALHSRSKRKKT